MGTFPIPPPDVPCSSIASINMISTLPHELPASDDPWIVPDPGDHLRFDDEMSLSPFESAYQAIQSATPSTPSLDELSPVPSRVIFPTDEMIMSVMEDTPWDDGHHHSILFLEKHTLENYQRILKVEAILNLPPPSTLRQLQSLQGKANFLHRFIPNYTEITRGFTRLLKKDFEFVWVTIANDSFEYLKLSLTRAPLLFPPDYSRDYFLYLAASDYTIGMVLVQEDVAHDEHVIYYLSRSLMPTEIKYQHVEKLALAVVQAIQRFRHYILSRKPTMISHCNPMQHILTRQLLGGKYSKWIVIL
jgi:hypothetical protein